eukprot:784855-Pyramimonas_sp.AAC.1
MVVLTGKAYDGPHRGGRGQGRTRRRRRRRRRRTMARKLSSMSTLSAKAYDGPSSQNEPC